MNGQTLSNGAELAGRAMLGLLFVIEGFSKLSAYDLAARYMTAYGMPVQLLPAAMALELGAGIMVMVGWHTRIAALALSAFCVVVAVIFHTRFSDLNQFIHFKKDVALAGAFLVVWARGAGAYSLDAFRARRARTA
jgi:putative oxidoreductase